MPSSERLEWLSGIWPCPMARAIHHGFLGVSGEGHICDDNCSSVVPFNAITMMYIRHKAFNEDVLVEGES